MNKKMVEVIVTHLKGIVKALQGEKEEIEEKDRKERIDKAKNMEFKKMT